MHRLLVLSSLAVAILTIPGLASAGNPVSPDHSIGATLAGKPAEPTSDYWTPERLAGATDLSVLTLPGDGTPAPAST